MLPKRKDHSGKPAGISEKVIRILEIYAIISEMGYPSVGSLAAHFNVSHRTILRYLELLKTIDAIAFHRGRKGYFFPHGSRMNKLAVSRDDLTALMTAKEAVSHLGKTFQDGFQGLATRIFAQTAKDSVSTSPITVMAPHVVQGKKLDECLGILPLCIQERRSVDIVYRARGKHVKTVRTVDPYGLVLHEGIWMLIAFCHLRREIRTFALDRVEDVRERYRYFTPRDDFDLNEFLSRPWGIMDGREVTVVVRFGEDAADYILRKDSWHPSEERKILADGSVELTFTVAGTLEIKKWIYSWLPQVEVIKPLWLRRQIQGELSEAAENHAKWS